MDRRRRLVAPQLVPGRGVVRDQMPVVRPDDHLAPPDGRGGVDVRSRVARPQEVAGPRAERVQGSIGVPDVHAPVGNGGRRIEVLAAVQEFGVGRPLPPDAPAARIEPEHMAAVGAHVHHAVRIGG